MYSISTHACEPLVGCNGRKRKHQWKHSKELERIRSRSRRNRRIPAGHCRLLVGQGLTRGGRCLLYGSPVWAASCTVFWKPHRSPCHPEAGSLCAWQVRVLQLQGSARGRSVQVVWVFFCSSVFLLIYLLKLLLKVLHWNLVPLWCYCFCLQFCSHLLHVLGSSVRRMRVYHHSIFLVNVFLSLHEVLNPS